MNKTFWYITLGVVLAGALNNTIAGFVNPILAPAKLSV